ncbi:MAG: hypothetical protein FWD33_02040 [Alphaproteobacteria bacterium]|nr:hypothetical protein [Alphaproteobacteria bacterium]
MRKILYGLIAAIAGISASDANTYFNQNAWGQGNFASQHASGNQNRASQQFVPGGWNNQQQRPAQQNPWAQPQQQQQRFGQQQPAQLQQQTENVTLDLHIGYEGAAFGFNMRQAHSELNFNDITWMKFGATGTYAFNVSGTNLEFKAGVELGVQNDGGKMTDDDMYKGGIYIGHAVFLNNGNVFQLPNGDFAEFPMTELMFGVGDQGNGSSMGFFASIGLGDGFRLGNSISLKPSVGYRFERQRFVGRDMLATSVQALVAATQTDWDNLLYVAEQCAGNPGCTIAIPYLDENNDLQFYFAGYVHGLRGIYNTNGDLVDVVPDLLTLSDAHELNGITHDYRVSWFGPFIAADLNFEHGRSSFNLRGEIGFPGYSAEADQPFRTDLAHPVSFRDRASMFSGMHYGLNMKYSHGVTDNMSLNIGWNWNYYTIRGADATTYYDPGSYAYQLFGPSQTLKNEINARYKTSGVRGGLSVKF